MYIIQVVKPVVVIDKTGEADVVSVPDILPNLPPLRTLVKVSVSPYIVSLYQMCGLLKTF